MKEQEIKEYKVKLIKVWNDMIDLFPEEIRKENHDKIQEIGNKYCITCNELLNKLKESK